MNWNSRSTPQNTPAPAQAEALGAFKKWLSVGIDPDQPDAKEAWQLSMTHHGKTIISALQSPARAVVKPLEWQEISSVTTQAMTPLGNVFTIRKDSYGRYWAEKTRESFFNTLEDAQAFFQSHWQQKIGECLTESAKPETLHKNEAIGKMPVRSARDHAFASWFRKSISEMLEPAPKIEGLREAVLSWTTISSLEEAARWAYEQSCKAESESRGYEAKNFMRLHLLAKEVLTDIARAQLAAQEDGNG